MVKGDFHCPVCRLDLKNVTLPVRCGCGTGDKKAARPECIHRGEQVREIECTICNGRKKIQVFECDVHGECVKQKIADDRLYETPLMSCQRCEKKSLGFTPQCPT